MASQRILLIVMIVCCQTAASQIHFTSKTLTNDVALAEDVSVSEQLQQVQSHLAVQQAVAEKRQLMLQQQGMEIKQLQNAMNELEARLNKTEQQSTPADFVGFSAYATSNQAPASGDVIALPGVVTNAGGAYNADTSTFTCPASAYYYI